MAGPDLHVEHDPPDRGLSTQPWQGLAEHSPAPVLAARGSEVVGANLAAASAFGCDRQELLGTDLFDLLLPEDRAGFTAFLNAAPEDGASRRTYSGTLATDATRVEIEVSPPGDERDPLRYISWRSATAPGGGERMLQALASAVPHPLVFCDPEGNLVWANDAACERTGYTPSRFRGRPLLPAIDPTDRRRIRVAFGRARRGRPTAGHVRMRSEAGELLEGDFRAVPVHSEGRLWGVLFVAMELTGPDRARDLPDAHRDRILSHLGTSLAHRLRNDLQALLGILTEPDRTAAPDQVLATVQKLVGSAVEDLRRFVAISRSGGAAAREVDLVEAVEPWFSRVRSALPRQVRISFRHEPIDPRALLDATQLALALDVALAAATAAMGDGGGAVELAIEEGQQPSTIRITLSDTGMLSEEQAAAAGASRLLFSRETALAVADLVAGRHSGRAGSKVRAGIGGKWWVEIPRAAARGEEMAALGTLARRGAVLVADDEEMVRSSLAGALREAGVETVEASNGREAVDLVLASPRRFALVVLDLVMPVMDGREALRQVRLAAPAVPVVVCTGYDPAGDGELSGTDLLIKPFSIEEFLAKVREALSRHANRERQGDSIGQ